VGYGLALSFSHPISASYPIGADQITAFEATPFLSCGVVNGSAWHGMSLSYEAASAVWALVISPYPLGEKS
jgi:hypothetical protein